jgi:tetrahydromethanopterin S-methyltransferase subunit B
MPEGETKRRWLALEARIKELEAVAKKLFASLNPQTNE